MRFLRPGLFGLGGLVSLYGVYLLLSRQEPDQWINALIWLAGGVIIHDFVFSIGVIALGVAVSRFVPQPARAPIAVGAVIFGAVTVMAVPVLLSLGATADNPTLLDRPYLGSWLVALAVVVVAVAVAAVVRVRRAQPAGPVDAADAAEPVDRAGPGSD